MTKSSVSLAINALEFVAYAGRRGSVSADVVLENVRAEARQALKQILLNEDADRARELAQMRALRAARLPSPKLRYVYTHETAPSPLHELLAEVEGQVTRTTN